MTGIQRPDHVDVRTTRPAVSLDRVTVTLPHPPRVAAARPALAGVDLEVEEGEVLLVVGPSGSGKSTLVRTMNGLVPHASGGTLAGVVTVFGRDTRTHRPRDLADVVGYVHQDPEAHSVVDRVEDDIAFGLENLGMDPVAMRRRVEEVLDALDVAHLRHRSPATLSGGERQRCAIAAALASGPRMLLLDEPTSQLDPQGADDVLAALRRLNDDLGTTVVLAEHRVDRAAPMADRVIALDRGRIDETGTPRDVFADLPGAPQVTRLGRLLGWSPLPLTVREARRAARHTPAPILPAPTRPDPAATPGVRLVGLERVTVTHRGAARPAVDRVGLAVHQGEVIALMGRNGAGKTTALRVIAGIATPDVGRRTGTATVAYVPQDPGALLHASTVRDEVRTTLQLLGRRDEAAVEDLLARLGLDELAERHPRSLSGGQRQRVAIAAVAVGAPDVLLLDEPTRGMDSAAMDHLEVLLASHAASGGAVVLATHDVELAARVATRVVILGDGEVVADGRARDVLANSLFAPAVLRVLPPALTVDEVRRAVEGRP